MDPPANGPDSDSTAAVVEKHRQFSRLLESTFDLLNSEITDEDWLSQLAELATCHSVMCIWWRAHLPQTYSASACGEPETDARAWVDYLEPALAAAQPSETRLIKGLTDEDRLLSPDRMVYFLDHGHVRVVFVFSQHKFKTAWDEDDEQHLLRVMRTIDKPVRLRRQLSLLSDIQELSNKFMDEMPRALAVLTPDGDIISTNRLAKKLIEKGELLRVTNEKLVMTDRAKHKEFTEQLNIALHLPKDEISDYVWHRNLSDSTEPGAVMLAMLCLPFSNWNLNSSARDRVIVMVMQIMGKLEVPTTSQLSEFYKLTRAQCNVVAQLMEGHSLEDAAENLHVSINTVRTHLRAIYSKLNVDNKTQLLQRISGTITGPKDL